MNKFLSIVLAGAFTAMSGYSAVPDKSNQESGSGAEWPAPLAFRPRNTTVSDQGLYKTVQPTDRKARSRSESAPVKVVSKTLNLCGSVLYSTTWSYEARYGVYSVPSNSQQSFNCLYSTPYMVNSYWENKEGKAYIVAEESFGSFSFYTMYIYDTETGELLETINLDNSNLVFTDMAEDPTTGEVYGCGVTSTGSFNWRKVNFETREFQNISKLPGQLIGVGCDKSGQFYAMGTNTVLYKVEKTTGELTPIIETGIPAQYNVGGCYNDDNDTFLQASSTDDFGRLYEVDIKTGKTTLLYDFPGSEEVTNLHFQKPLAAPKAPAAGEMMILPTDDGSLKVEALLSMPDALFDGTAIGAGTTLTYFIDIDGVVAKTGKAATGEDLSVMVDVASSGNHTFAFYTENEVGKSPKVYDSGYVGSAAPEAPASAEISLNGQSAVIKWKAATKAVTEGYFDASKVKYVVRDNNGTAVAGPVSDLEVTLTAPAADKFTILKYSVAAMLNDAASEETFTNGIILGSMETPCEIDAREQDFYDSFLIIDSNNDGCSWIFDGYNTGYTNTEMADADKQKANDWLITNGVYLKANHYYEISSVFTTTSWMGANENIDIMCGSDRTVEAMTIPINESTVVSGFSTVSGTLSVPADGVYYLGYHITSEKEQEGLSLQWVKISEGVSFTAPAAPAVLSGTADADGDPKANLSFRFPSKTMEGKDISGSLKMRIFVGNEMVKELAGNPSEEASADVVAPTTGQTEFLLKAVNGAGEIGKAASIKVSLGPRKPATPASVNAYQVENGKVRIEWTPVTTGTDSKPIKEEYMSYNIHFATGGYVGDLIESGVTGDHYIFDSGIASGQEFYQFVVVPCNRGVTGTGKGTYQTPTGIPYTVPFSLSHQNDLKNYIVAESTKETEIGFVADQQNISSADNDGQFIGMVFDKYTSAGATYGRIYTGLVKLTGVNPTLNFYVCKFGNDDNNYSTCGIIIDGTYTQLLKVNNSSLAKTGWNKVSVSLDNYGGRLAQIDLRGYYGGSASYKLYAFDAIKVTNVQRYDVEASLQAPQTVENGRPFTVTATVTNVGSNSATSCTMYLYRGDELLKSQKFSNMAADATNSFSVSQTLNVTDPAQVEYKVTVDYEMDRNKDNNTAAAAVSRQLSTLPGIDNLKGERTAEGHVSLSWEFNNRTDSHKGYNVYANGVKINNLPVSDKSYIHESVHSADYQVSALYESGESELSSPVKVDSSGIGSLYAGGVEISVDGSLIKVNEAGNRSVTIVSADGAMIHNGYGDVCVSVVAGVYMVNVSGQTVKVIVK